MELITSDRLASRVRALAEMPLARQLALMIGLALAVAIGVAAVLWSREPVYRPLYANLTTQDSSEVVAALQARGVAYQIDENNGAILVPADAVHGTRIALASAGLPKASGVGFELLDHQGTFGESEFMESVRYQRVLEGELGRTIGSLADVRGVRVHLALPKRSLFVREREKASASVLVNLAPGRTLEAAQVQAIMHLVSASVPNLERSRITVIDQTGQLLSPEEDAEGLEGSSSQLSYAHRLEASYARRVEEILTPILGSGRVRAQVVADLDFTVVESTEETFGRESKSVRSEQVGEQSSKGAPSGGIPGALSNQPPAGGSTAADGAAGAGGGSESSSKNTTRNFELDRTVRHVRAPSGALKRLSVAVVVDTGPALDKDGKPIGQPTPAKSIEDLTVLVKKAVGFNEARGDSVQVVNASFRTSAEELTVPTLPLWEQPWFWSLVKQGLGGLVVLLLALLVLRPLLRGLPGASPPAPAADQLALANASADALPALGAPDALAPDQIDVSQAAQLALSALPAASDYAGQVARTQALIAGDPPLAADIVKEWLANEG
ncbi:MAG: flagellar basal-body MS-ring/collar protein FliF [Azonexus sp.]